jgi:purine catabolism regulator
MRLTLGEAMRIYPLSEGQVLAGHQGLDRKIEFVTVTDTPALAQWLKGGEFVLGTLYSIKDDKDAQIHLIHTLYEKNAAGLGIKTKSFLPSDISHLLKEAEMLHFPVIEINQNCSWADVINPVLTEVLNRQVLILERARNIHNQILHHTFQENAVPMILSNLQEILGYPVGIMDMEGKIRDASGTKEDPEEGKLHEAFHSFSMDFAGIRFGDLVVFTQGQPIPQPDIPVLESAAQICAIDIHKQHSINLVEQRFKNDFLLHILTGQITSSFEIEERCKGLGLNLPERAVVVIIDMSDYIAQRETGLSRNGVGFKEKVLRDMTYLCRKQNVNSIYIDLSTILIFLVEEKAMIKEIAHDLLNYHPAIGVSVSRSSSSRADLPLSYREAQETLRLGLDLWGFGKQYHFEDLGLYRLFSQVGDKQELVRFYEETIKPILDYDLTNEMNLLHSLEVFFQSNEDIRLTSKLLFVHHNTLRYRLQRIEEITGKSPFELDGKMELYLGIKISILLKLHTPYNKVQKK